MALKNNSIDRSGGFMLAAAAPKISVLMPVYNALPWLHDAVNSILSQSYADFEFIIIDDCSSDGSADILKSYSEQDERINIILSNENIGVAAALNKGLLEAKGEYIARMDADDISFPNRFAIQVEYLEKNLNCGVVGSWIERLRKNGSKKIKKYPENSSDLKLMLMFECCFSHPSVMIRRSVFDFLPNYYDENFKSAQDYELWSRLKNFCDFHCIQQPLLTYRELGGSVSMQARKNNTKRERVNRIYENLLKLNGINDRDFIELHKQIVHKDKRWCLNPVAIENHLAGIFSFYPDASNKKEVRDSVFRSLNKNPLFLLKFIFAVLLRRIVYF